MTIAHMFYVFSWGWTTLTAFLSSKRICKRQLLLASGVDMFIHHTSQVVGGGGGEGQRYVYILYIKKGSAYVGRFCIFL
jgi:hypothetical protein